MISGSGVPVCAAWGGGFPRRRSDDLSPGTDGGSSARIDEGKVMTGSRQMPAPEIISNPRLTQSVVIRFGVNSRSQSEANTRETRR
jgi:hypothetical protein